MSTENRQQEMLERTYQYAYDYGHEHGVFDGHVDGYFHGARDAVVGVVLLSVSGWIFGWW